MLQIADLTNTINKYIFASRPRASFDGAVVLFQNIIEWPNIEDAIDIRWTKVILAAAHLDHDPTNNRTRYLKGLCQRCHMIHYRPHHLARRRITYLLRRAIGDLFLGPYKPIYWNEAGRAPNLLDQVI